MKKHSYRIIWTEKLILNTGCQLKGFCRYDHLYFCLSNMMLSIVQLNQLFQTPAPVRKEKEKK